MAEAIPARQIRQERFRDGSRDFDFLRGRYRVHNIRFAGQAEQEVRRETYAATNVATPLPCGIGRVDALVPDGHADPARTILRLYDRRSCKWTLYRVDQESGMLQPPLQGCFDGGVGVFEGWDEPEQQAVRARLIWSHVTAATARCERTFSRDNGASWESRWIQYFTRLDDQPPTAAPDRGLLVATGFLFVDPEL